MAEKQSRIELIAGKNLSGDKLKAKDIPKEEIESYHKEEVLKYKSESTKYIIADTIATSVGIALILMLLYYNNLGTVYKEHGFIKFTICIIIIASTLGLCGYELCKVPKRIINLIGFDFERTCYAEIVYKYTRKEVMNDHIKTKYYVNVVIDKDRHMNNIRIRSKERYNSIKEGDKVIISSYDGVRVTVISIGEVI